MEQIESNILLPILRTLLTPKEETVLRIRFGIGIDRCHTRREVGRFLSLFPDAIGRIERRAFKKLNDPFLVDKIKSYRMPLQELPREDMPERVLQAGDMAMFVSWAGILRLLRTYMPYKRLIVRVLG
jgi:hypothetical protein